SVCIKQFSKYEEPFVLSAYQFMLGGLLLFVIGFMWKSVTGGDLVEVKELVYGCFEPKGLGVILLLAGISAIAYSLWGLLLKYNEVSKVTIYGFLTPVFGVLFSALFLSETTIAGPVVVVISLILVSLGIILQN
ncbi:MAG: DMT family transporter, partial [Lachnospiraceae bacterium]|nr:DMT family transporter [Lachnospiraceae bacterium]